MGTLFIDHGHTELRWRDDALELRRDGRLLRTVPARLLERVVLRAETVVTSSTLAHMADAGIGIVALGGRSGQKIAHLLGGPVSDARARIAQCQRVDDEAFAGPWCARLVRAKLRAQQRVLNHALAQRPDQRLPLSKALRSLADCLDALQGCQDRCRVRGIEGAAAAAYFRGYASLFAPALAFTKRQRRPAPDPVNACLSLGYTLLHAHAVQACWAAGLDPMVGFLHLPAHGRASMACDLMEPWRPRVDAWVWEQFRQAALRPEHFGRDGAAACVIGKAGRAYFYKAVTPLLADCARGLRRHARLAALGLTDAVRLPEVDDVSEDSEP
ncbi:MULTISPECIES: CRISPR-associated endonuclease Cas1 [Caldimonas]|uniref:CRISPR-associated endonuclease Cas1 n=1 Tax=Caldimonas TaxID=196013 RepID=UPI00078117CF|nr:CRISPR-associated endonuclease Cas1 [Caldimonas taiwanensis]MCX7659415.1 CRISPR-associated endonuclease Cas1 [Caldimonas manganoxidans]GIX24254.1 MAG: hypothetical protein KatS3mg122_1485 [Caldimonas sp.]